MESNTNVTRARKSISAAQAGRWACASMFLVNGFVVGSWSPHIPGVAKRLALDEFALGLLILSFGLGAIVAMSVSGQMIARIGSRRTLLVFALPVIGALPVVLSMPGFWSAALALTVFGGAVGGMDVAMNANVVLLEKRLERAIMSSSHGFWSLGGFVGGALGGILIERVGVLPHAWGVTLIAVLIVSSTYSILADDRGPVRSGLPTEVVHTRGRLPRHVTIYVIGAMALLCLCAEGAILSWSALYLQKAMLADTATAGFAFAGFSGAMAITRFLGDRVRNWLGAVKTFRISGVIAGVALAVAGLVESPWIAIIAFSATGVGIANMVPILFSSAGNQPDVDAGVAISVVTTMGHSGILLAPSIIGFLGGHFGLGSVYLGLAILLGLLMLLAGNAASADTRHAVTETGATG
ncbi:MFS transporter [Roseinatronobacter alkalisoli]|uniref:MFS transporter n=1 Tax=Roseinatronobacter alkalisoli TaxID=3028235 RepID=A0ABT5TEN2_9RHOB|nr:MFS transporter [Roseinatronobacter sp. HJB301]MDD7973587.1 MFS transporter [Roseinatronobacter sp. HJB301]